MEQIEIAVVSESYLAITSLLRTIVPISREAQRADGRIKLLSYKIDIRNWIMRLKTQFSIVIE